VYFTAVKCKQLPGGPLGGPLRIKTFDRPVPWGAAVGWTPQRYESFLADTWRRLLLAD
jgi:hypothetical protein